MQSLHLVRVAENMTGAAGTAAETAVVHPGVAATLLLPGLCLRLLKGYTRVLVQLLLCLLLKNDGSEFM